MRTSKQMRGRRVRKDNGKKTGKIKEIVFTPESQQVMGYIVSRPDVLLMFKRKDKFLAHDKISINVDGDVVAAAGSGVWDDSALKRMQRSLDDAVIWRNMPVSTEDGREIGFISDLAYDETTGQLLGVRLSDGALATALLGRKDISKDMIISCGRQGVLVRPAAVAVEAEGGAVDTAAQATAIAGDRITRGAKVAANAATQAADKVQKHTSGMFSSFKEEYDKASKGEDSK